MRPIQPGLPALVALALVVQALAGPQSTFLLKLAEIRDRYEKGASEPKEFRIHEAEANDYLRNGAELPPGIESPWVRFEEGIAIAGATVDLEQFRSNLPSSMVFQLLTGRVPVEATARVSGENGMGKIDLERVLLAGMELPASLVASLAESEKASEFLPPGFQLGKPFALPYNLESLRCERAVVPIRQRATSAGE